MKIKILAIKNLFNLNFKKMTKYFLDSEFLKKLEYLNLIAKRTFTGETKGERRSSKRGYSVEFADYKDYSVGDDFRYVDWNVFGRLERLVVKLFMEEEDLFIYLLIDASESMNYGQPNKLEYAKHIASALAYVGLSNLNRVGLGIFADGLISVLPPKRGKSEIFNIMDFLQATKPSGITNLAQAGKNYSLRHKRAGLAIIISDFYDINGYQEALKYFIYRKCEIFALQIFSPEELNPSLTGDLKLIDIETDIKREITVTERIIEHYKMRLTIFCKEIEQFCQQRGINYLRASTSTPFEDLVLKYFRQRLWVR